MNDERGRLPAAGISPTRRALLPAPTLPILHFAGAQLALATAFTLLAIQPHLPGAFHYHPRLIALLHLVTLGTISGSILGALYIVAPLALGVSLRAHRMDAVAAAAFWTGTAGMVGGFWSGRFAIVGGSSLLVLAAFIIVGARVIPPLFAARLPRGVSLHITLAFVNIAVAGAAGALMAVSRLTGGLPWPPLALALAHGHLAVLGWATMMIFGVAYRLIPMFLPAAMPSDVWLGASAVLLEAGTLGLAATLMFGGSHGPWAVLVLAAFASFVVQIRRTLHNRRPRPVDLPRRDWSTWHTHLALMYLMVAAGLGIWLAIGAAPPAVTWAYGAAGILGFVVQMVAGIQGRLLPLYAWYRSLEQANGAQPRASVHSLIAPRLALTVFLAWLVGLPVLMTGLMAQQPRAIAGGAVILLFATVTASAHGVLMLRRAQQ
jgi:hypothetical protein